MNDVAGKLADLLDLRFGDDFMEIASEDHGADFYGLIQGTLFAFVVIDKESDRDDAEHEHGELIRKVDDAGGRFALVYDPEAFVAGLVGS